MAKIKPTDDPEVRAFSELSDTGMLWFINRSVFHPLGYALALHMDDEGETIGWLLLGDGTESWSFSEHADDECFRKVHEFIGAHRSEEAP